MFLIFCEPIHAFPTKSSIISVLQPAISTRFLAAVPYTCTHASFLVLLRICLFQSNALFLIKHHLVKVGFGMILHDPNLRRSAYWLSPELYRAISIGIHALPHRFCDDPPRLDGNAQSGLRLCACELLGLCSANFLCGSETFHIILIFPSIFFTALDLAQLNIFLINNAVHSLI